MLTQEAKALGIHGKDGGKKVKELDPAAQKKAQELADKIIAKKEVELDSLQQTLKSERAALAEARREIEELKKGGAEAEDAKKTSRRTK